MSDPSPRIREASKQAAVDRFRRLYTEARGHGYKDTKAAFCDLLLRTRGLPSKTAKRAATVWLQSHRRTP